MRWIRASGSRRAAREAGGSPRRRGGGRAAALAGRHPRPLRRDAALPEPRRLRVGSLPGAGGRRRRAPAPAHQRPAPPPAALVPRRPPGRGDPGPRRRAPGHRAGRGDAARSPDHAGRRGHRPLLVPRRAPHRILRGAAGRGWRRFTHPRVLAHPDSLRRAGPARGGRPGALHRAGRGRSVPPAGGRPLHPRRASLLTRRALARVRAGGALQHLPTRRGRGVAPAGQWRRGPA